MAGRAVSPGTGDGTGTGAVARAQAARARQQAPEPSARRTRRMPGKLTGHPRGRERELLAPNGVKRDCVELNKTKGQGDSDSSR